MYIYFLRTYIYLFFEKLQAFFHFFLHFFAIFFEVALRLVEIARLEQSGIITSCAKSLGGISQGPFGVSFNKLADVGVLGISNIVGGSFFDDLAAVHHANSVGDAIG